jgi:hypothetical protein
MFQRICMTLTIVTYASVAYAQFDPAKVTQEAEAVSQHFPDPDAHYVTPGFRPGRQDFTSHAEAMGFVEALARESPHAKVEILGISQRGLVLPLVLLTDARKVDPRLPTVLIIAQQHGNEPAGGETALVLAQQLAGPRAELLRRVNVLIIPRGNPDGAEGFKRATANGIDVNRDHLLLSSPEGRAIALAIRKYKPQVMLDLHEFTVAGRWVEKFGGVMKYDALLQPATVGNLDAQIAAHAQRDYVDRIHAALAAHGLTSFAYHTTGPVTSQDKIVSMGGVQPDTGRNVGGLRPAISLLIEVRGVGIGRAHFLRRVHTQLLAATTVIETAAAQGSGLMRLIADTEAHVTRGACRGDIVIEAHLTPRRQRLTFLDAATGQELPTDVDWRAASPLKAIRSRSRPCGYLIGSDQKLAIERLRLLGVKLHKVVRQNRWQVQRYAVVRDEASRREDARGAIEDDQPIRKIEVVTERGSEIIPPGAVYVPLAQPLAPIIMAALEPDSQSSFAANHVLDLEASRLRRVLHRPPAEVIGELP